MFCSKDNAVSLGASGHAVGPTAFDTSDVNLTSVGFTNMGGRVAINVETFMYETAGSYGARIGLYKNAEMLFTIGTLYVPASYTVPFHIRWIGTIGAGTDTYYMKIRRINGSAGSYAQLSTLYVLELKKW